MPIQFDNLPSSRPQTEVETGRVLLTVDTVTAQRTTDNKYDSLKIVFRTPSQRPIYETFVDNPEKPFLMFKLGRLLHALDIHLPGATVYMSDLVKLIRKGAQVYADVIKNDRGYGQVSFDKGAEGFYPTEKTFAATIEPKKEETKQEPTLDSDLSNMLASDDDVY